MGFWHIPFCEPLRVEATTASDVRGRFSQLDCRDTYFRVCDATPVRERPILLFSILILFSCCLPLALCGCLGGQIIGAAAAAANGGSLHASPNTVSFGGVALGTTASLTVTVVNQGSAAVNVSQISVLGQAFSVGTAGNLPITVAAGGTYSVNVNFTPAGMGAAAGQLTIMSDSKTDGTLAIGLSGTGTAVSSTPSPELMSLSCAFDGATGSAIDNCTVALNSAAANGGFAVSLSSDNSATTVPAAVIVAAGSTTASFTANVSPVSSAQTATLTASASGVSETFALQLNASALSQGSTGSAALNGLSCAFGSMTGEGSDGCAVMLSAAAPSGGFVVSLVSNNPEVVLPATVTVAAGSTSGSFTATAFSVSSTQAVTLNASAGGVGETFVLQLNASTLGPGGAEIPVLSGLNCTNTSMTGAGTDSCTVTLSAAAPGNGVGVSLVSNNPAVVLPATLTVAAGLAAANFTATVSPVSSEQAVTLTAGAGGSTETFALQLNASTLGQGNADVPVLTGMTCAIGTVTGAGSDDCTVTLNAAAPSGGFGLSLASNNAAVAVPVTLTVPAGLTTANFTATVSPVNSAQTAMLTASAGGVAEDFPVQLNVAAAGLNIDATSIAFGNVPLNTPVTQSVELTASGLLPIAIGLTTVQGSGFSISGATFPLTLVNGQTANVEITFDPTTAGPSIGQLIIVSTDLAGGTAVVSLTGTGESEAVNLTWDAPSNSTDPIAGYNVYRAPTGSANFQQLNTLPIQLAAYVDTTVQSAQSYDYIVESVDLAGVTSAPSNTASATLP